MKQFIDGIIDDVVLIPYKKNTDKRGWLVEIFRNDELKAGQAPAMAYISATVPGVTRGPHEHIDQTDFFGFIGPSTFKVCLWDARKHSPTFGKRMFFLAGEDNPMAVLVPPGVVHAYRNVGSVDGWVFNGPNRLYAGNGKKEKVDEIRHEEESDSPYIIE
jgi:dTDP-4-dehydrorhamnose 3,5-epimerase